jgi:hypothetical protein
MSSQQSVALALQRAFYHPQTSDRPVGKQQISLSYHMVSRRYMFPQARQNWQSVKWKSLESYKNSIVFCKKPLSLIIESIHKAWKQKALSRNFTRKDEGPMLGCVWAPNRECSTCLAMCFLSFGGCLSLTLTMRGRVDHISCSTGCCKSISPDIELTEQLELTESLDLTALTDQVTRVQHVTWILFFDHLVYFRWVYGCIRLTFPMLPCHYEAQAPNRECGARVWRLPCNVLSIVCKYQINQLVSSKCDRRVDIRFHRHDGIDSVCRMEISGIMIYKNSNVFLQD